MEGLNEPPNLRRRANNLINTLRSKTGNRDAASYFQVSALGLLIVLATASVLLFKAAPGPSDLAGAAVFNSQEGQKKVSAAGLFLDGRRQLAAPPALITVQNSALAAAVPSFTVEPRAFGILGGVFYQQLPEPEVVRYVVQEGDTVESIAADFGISMETVLWANELKSGTELIPGKELVILPVSGALHAVRPGDTLGEIAAWYKVDIEEIISFNQIDSPEKIVVGDLLIIPDGTKPARLPQGRLSGALGSFYPPTGRPYSITQGLHHFNAIDFGAPCGSSVYAAASGSVQRTGYSSVAGNYIRILHPNGVVTFYGHLSAIGVKSGQQVVQGSRIGSIGRTGYTTGCHVHFEVRGAANPFAR